MVKVDRVRMSADKKNFKKRRGEFRDVILPTVVQSTPGFKREEYREGSFRI